VGLLKEGGYQKGGKRADAHGGKSYVGDFPSVFWYRMAWAHHPFIHVYYLINLQYMLPRGLTSFYLSASAILLSSEVIHKMYLTHSSKDKNKNKPSQ
jgi:hypothetical protein